MIHSLPFIEEPWNESHRLEPTKFSSTFQRYDNLSGKFSPENDFPMASEEAICKMVITVVTESGLSRSPRIPDLAFVWISNHRNGHAWILLNFIPKLGRKFIFFF